MAGDNAAEMEIYLLVSSARNLRAFTSDPTGANLPADYRPWQTPGAGTALPVHDPVHPVSSAVARDGFFLMSGKNGPIVGRVT